MYAFQNYRANRPDSTRWVGFENFQDIFSDPEFFQTAFLTAQFAISATVVETLLGIGVALLLARSSAVSRLLERLLIVPLMIAPVIAAIIWRLMMLPTVGVLNYLLSPFGIQPEWTGSPGWALFSIILVDVGPTRRLSHCWCSPDCALYRERHSRQPLSKARGSGTPSEISPCRCCGRIFWWPSSFASWIRSRFSTSSRCSLRGPRRCDDGAPGAGLRRGDHLLPLFARVHVYAHSVDRGLHRDAWSHRRLEPRSGSRCRSLTLGTRRIGRDNRRPNRSQATAPARPR